MIKPVVVFQFTFLTPLLLHQQQGSGSSFPDLAALYSSGETFVFHSELSSLLTQVTEDSAFREMGMIFSLIVFLTDN